MAVYVWGMNSRTQIVFFACDELAFTALDVIEQQLRLNKIDAALDTMSRIADATVRSAAMEAIAISQFKAGDQRGALHTANLIPHELNRNGVLTHIAFAQARSGCVKGAIETINEWSLETLGDWLLDDSNSSLVVRLDLLPPTIRN